VQVASGQNPITALVQQGSQLSGTFGGIRPALAAVASLVTPAVVGVGALATTVIALGSAFVQGWRESRQLNDSIALTGNYAGVTAGEVERMARAIAALNARPVGNVREALAAAVGSGKFGPQSIEVVTTAVVQLQRFTGQSAEEIVKSFGGITSGVARWAAEQNKAYNFLTPKVYDQIRALEAQGNTQEAIALAVGALSDKLAGQTRNLGFLEQGYEKAKTAASSFWEYLKSLGRDETTDDVLERARTRLQQLRLQLQADRPGRRLSATEQEALTGAEAAVAAIERRLQQQRGAVQQAAAEAERNQKDIEDRSASHQGALSSIDRAGIARRTELAETSRVAEMAALEKSYAQELISAKGYVTARVSIERELIDAKERALNDEIALERRRPVGSRTDVAAQQGKLLELENRRLVIQRERVELARRAAGGQLEPPERKRDTLGEFIDDQVNAAKRRDEQRAEQARARTADLVQTNRELSVSFIADDRTRGQAQIAIEEAALRRRIDLTVLAADERKAAEESVAQFVLLRQRQLEEQLKPEWQRLSEGWADTTRQMRESGDRFLTGFLQQGEATWLEFSKTGKLNLASFGDLVRDELARLTYRSTIAPAVESIGKTIAGAIGIKVPGATDLTAAKAAEKLVTDEATASLGALKLAADGATTSLGRVAGGNGAASGFSLSGLFGGGGGGGDPIPWDLDFAKGAAFDRAGIVERFAAGEVFDRPTRFRYGGGRRGEMGEAGPEAVMPLTRLPGGRLGVHAAGGGAAPVVQLHVEVVNNNANARVRTEQRPDGGLRVLVDTIEDALGGRIDNGGGLLKNIVGRTGGNPGAGLIR
jgi:phage-related minor tail protein